MKNENIENVTPEEVTTTPETSTEVTTGVVNELTETLTEPTPKKKSIALPLICVILGLGIAVFAYLSLTKGNKPVEVDTDSLESSTSVVSSSSSETSVSEESSEEESEVSSTVSSTTSSRPTTSSSRPATVSSSTPQPVSSTAPPVSSTAPPPPVSSTAPPPPPPPAAWVCSQAEADSICASVNAWLEANGGVNWSLSWENNEGYTIPTQADLFTSYDSCLNSVMQNAQQEISHFGSAGYVRCVVVPYGNTYLIAVVRG